jgi:hypothetical protein
MYITFVFAVGLYAGGCKSAPANVSRVKPPVANSQFRGSDHMPAQALAAKRAAGY